MTQKPLIGQILIEDGAVSEGALARALGYQRATRQSFRLGSILLDWDLLAEDKLLEALSKLHRCPPVTWAELSQTGPEALQALSSAFAVRLGAFPYAIDGSGLRVAFRNPSDLAAVDEVASVSRRRLIPGVTTEAALVLAYHRFYGRPVPADFKDLIQKVDRGRVASARARPAIRSAPVPSAASDPREASAAPSSPVVPRKRAAAPRIPGAEAAPASERGPLAALTPAPAPAPKPSPPQAVKPRKPAVEIDRERFAESVVEKLLTVLPRVLVFRVGKSAINGWTGRGPGLTPEIVAALRVRTGGESVIPEVARSGAPHFGLLERERLSFPLRGMLERDAPGCAVFPIRVLGTVEGILYADRLGEPMLEGDSAVLSEAAQTLEKRLSRSRLPGGEG